MNEKDPGFFQKYGVPFAWGYWDARTAGIAKPPTKLIREEIQAYELGYARGELDERAVLMGEKLG